jgi:hypothetical protein
VSVTDITSRCDRTIHPTHPQVLYGATDMLSGAEFLQQLEELARRSGIQPSSSTSAAAAAAGGGGGGA